MRYHVNTQRRDDGTTVLHAARCQFLPREDHRASVGDHDGCEAALEAARRDHGEVTPCHVCCSDCA